MKKFQSFRLHNYFGICGTLTLSLFLFFMLSSFNTKDKTLKPPPPPNTVLQHTNSVDGSEFNYELYLLGTNVASRVICLGQSLTIYTDSDELRFSPTASFFTIYNTATAWTSCWTSCAAWTTCPTPGTTPLVTEARCVGSSPTISWQFR